MSVLSLPQKLWDALVTLHLFNKYDLWTIELPITAFSLALAVKNLTVTQVCSVLTWIWISLLSFTVSNQSFGNSPEEDAANKPNRPIPAKRISVASARILRWLLIPVNLSVSLVFGAFPAGLGISTLTLIHDEGSGHSHWFTKNLCCAGLYAFFEYGGTLVADASRTLTQDQLTAIVGSALIILTTIHAQDFRDDEGDAMLGRRTFTLAYPTFARVTMPMLLLGWSVVLYFRSTTALWIKGALILLSFVVGMRFLLLRNAKDDRVSYNLYNIWLSTAHVALSGLNTGLIL